MNRTPFIISCAVMIEEIKPLLPAGAATETVEMSLHTRPKLLREKLQEIIDRVDGAHDPIILGYGMCGLSTVGLMAQRSRLVVPRADDCIAIFLGSQKALRAEMAREPGTYFLTRGWLGDGAEGPFADYDRMVEKYGAERARRLLGKMIGHYTRLAFLRTMDGDDDAEDKARAEARTIARRFNLRYEELDATNSVLARMMKGDWSEDFIVVEPGEAIHTLHFLEGRAARK